MDNFTENATFSFEKKGYKKEEVDTFLKKTKENYEKIIFDVKEKNEILRNKNEELTERIMELQAQKSEVARIILDAEARANEIIENAKEKAQEECNRLDEEAEEKRRIIVEQNEKLRQFRLETLKLFSAFNDVVSSAMEKTKSDADIFAEKIRENMNEASDMFDVQAENINRQVSEEQ